jgi:glycosyltransferase involved in cell wall biosynthesis
MTSRHGACSTQGAAEWTRLLASVEDKRELMNEGRLGDGGVASDGTRQWNRSVPDGTASIALAYVGSVVPDTPAYRTEAFSRAGNMSQTNLITGLKAAGSAPSLVLCVRPVPAFPRSRTVFSRFATAVLASGVPVNYMAFLNVTPIKQFQLGIATVWGLARWGWKHRHVSARVVYTFNLTVPPAVFTLLAARLIGAKAIASVYDINEPGETVPRSSVRKLDYWLHKRLLPRFDGLVVISRAIVDDFAPTVPHIRVEGGVAPEMMTGPGGHQTVRKPGCFYVGFAGSFDAANGVSEILQASALLRGSHYRFLLAGNGPLTEEVRRAAAMDPRIEYRGFLSLKDVLSLYAEADVLVNMRLTKTMRTRYFFPSKLFEFLASGTPVISTCTGHVEEEFSEFVFLLKNETADGLAEAIRRAEGVGGEARKDMGVRAREFIVANKTWAIQTKRIAEFIGNVAGCSNGCS